MLIEIMYGISIGGMERERNHGFHLIKVDMNHAVIVCDLAGLKLFIIIGTLMCLEESTGGFIGLPNGGEAGGLGGHDINAVTEVNGEICDAGAYEFEYAVIYEAGSKGCSDKSDSHVVGTDALLGLTGEINHDDLGHIVIPCIVEELLCKLGTAFTDRHGAESAVTGMAVGAENHCAALCHFLTGVGMDNAYIGGNEDSAVLLGSRKPEHMVIFVDGSADGTEAVVAVGQSVGQREFLHAGGTSLLNDADIGDVMRDESVKLYLKLIRISGMIMRLKDAVSNGILLCFLHGHVGGFTGNTVNKVHTFFNKFDHASSSYWILFFIFMLSHS